MNNFTWLIINLLIKCKSSDCICNVLKFVPVVIIRLSKSSVKGDFKSINPPLEPPSSILPNPFPLLTSICDVVVSLPVTITPLVSVSNFLALS